MVELCLSSLGLFRNLAIHLILQFSISWMAPTTSSGSQVQHSDYVIVFDAPDKDTAVSFVRNNLKLKSDHGSISEAIT
jgi:hypothetical protein